MIPKFDGYDDAKKSAQKKKGEQLPAGPYVCKIYGVKLGEGFIKVQFDVEEGEYKGFFHKQYKENTAEDKKYKGMATIWLPKDDGSQGDVYTKEKFARWTNSLEESNEGYVWDWDETKWKGKLIGILYGEVGKRIEDKDITYNEVRYPASVEYVRSGKAKAPKFYAYKGYQAQETPVASTSADFMNIPENIAEELPF